MTTALSVHLASSRDTGLPVFILSPSDTGIPLFSKKQQPRSTSIRFPPDPRASERATKLRYRKISN